MNNVAKKEKTAPAADEQNVQAEQAEQVEQAEQTPEQTEVQKLQQALDAANDKFLRLAAEYDNYRKRTAREKEELNGVCKSAIIAEILPVIDNLDRALDNKTDNFDDYKKGVEMIGAQFYTALDKLGIEAFGAPGDTFDPNLHNAVMHIEDENLGENVIAAVFVKGYRLGDKVIRPATVQVAN